MGNIYLPKALPLTELPDERMQFTLGFLRRRRLLHDEGCYRRVSGAHRYEEESGVRSERTEAVAASRPSGKRGL